MRTSLKQYDKFLNFEPRKKEKIAMEIPVKEGYIPFRDYKTWYRIVGEGKSLGKLPLLCLHGGPGAAWDYFEPLEAIVKTGRSIVFYDQLGGGNSDVPQDLSICSVALYLEEVETVRQALGLDRVHILGHSWGGMLAMEYALTQPGGLLSLILADTGASMPQWMAECRRLVAELPQDIQRIILKHEAEGTTDSPEYGEACRVFSQRHLGRRIDPRPECLARMAGKPGDDVYQFMWGPSEWYLTGTLKDWDITNRLGEIRVPSLVIGGRHDEATPMITQTLHHGILGSEWVIFENSGHFPHIEETERYLQVLDQFLCRVEAQR
jgi:proline-specific peptidase